MQHCDSPQHKQASHSSVPKLNRLLIMRVPATRHTRHHQEQVHSQDLVREACRAGDRAAGPGGGNAACQQRRPAGQAGPAAAVGCCRPPRSCLACAQQTAGAAPCILSVWPWQGVCNLCSLWGPACRNTAGGLQSSQCARARGPRLQCDVEFVHMAAQQAAHGAGCQVLATAHAHAAH